MPVMRVSKQTPCPICQHTNWCLLGTDAAICMRVAGGKEHTFKDHSVGWIHQLGGPVRAVPKREREETINAAAIMEEWRGRAHASNQLLADELGVAKRALDLLGCVWTRDHQAWAFPMFNGGSNVVGIRLRANGAKWAVKGSRQGLFIPAGPAPRRVVVCEGPTDAAAALTIGLFPIGRPHCSGGVEEIKEFIKRRGVKEMVIVSDDDEPGLRGAAVLAEAVPITTALLVMPAKDMRSFVNAGGTAEIFTSLLSSVVWRKQL